jgi:hypothetical protein
MSYTFRNSSSGSSSAIFDLEVPTSGILPQNVYINCRPFEFGKADIYIPLEDEDVLICEIKRRQTDSVDHIFLRSKLVSNSAP